VRLAGSFLLRLLWPARCVACGAVADVAAAFCSICATSVLRLTEACPRCARSPVPAHLPCEACRARPFPFHSAAAPLVYGGAVAEAILRFKHGRWLAAATPLGRLVAPVLAQAAGQGAELALPVPLHPRRLRERGFNQALELLRAAESERRHHSPGQLRILVDTLRRKRDTPALDRDPPRLRRERVAGAFFVSHPRRLRGRRVVILDDVMTTGATLAACTEAVLEAGAGAVFVVALARAL
jgi:predicted amidophosphoribosyltransferase